MGMFYGSRTLRERREAGLPMSLPCPNDFAETFVTIGRFACQEYYCVGRGTINRWLDERGKQELIDARSAHVREVIAKQRARPRPVDFEIAFVALGWRGCKQRYGADSRMISRWLDECDRERLTKARYRQTGRHDLQLNRRDVGRILAHAFPLSLSGEPDGTVGSEKP
jgi:hypothetical protein